MQIANEENNHILTNGNVSFNLFVSDFHRHHLFSILFWNMGSTKIAQMRFVFLFNIKYKKSKMKYIL